MPLDPSANDRGQATHVVTTGQQERWAAICAYCGKGFNSLTGGKLRRAVLYCSVACADKAQPDMAQGEWLPIESAPRTGEHILVSDRRPGQIGYGHISGKHQPFAVVAHWFDDGAGESGFYQSATAGDPDALQDLTHWKPL